MNNPDQLSTPVSDFTIQCLRGGEQLSSADNHTFNIFWIRSGSAKISIGFNTFEIENHTIICCAPGQHIRFGGSESLSGYLLMINDRLMQGMHDQSDASAMILHSTGSHHPITVRDLSTIEEIDTIIRIIHQEVMRNACERIGILKSYLKVLLLHLSREASVANRHSVFDKNLQMVKTFLLLVQEKIGEKKLVSQYADELCVTPSYLNLVVKKYSGKTASKHIQNHIISEAKRRAIYSGQRMKEIANELGFVDQSHFSKYFKTYSGVNFSNFKRELTN